MDDLRDVLRSVWLAISAAKSFEQPFVRAASEPPRHLAGANPVSKAVRWLKSITRTESPTSSPNLVTPTKQGIHETPFMTSADQEKKSLAILCFRNLANDPSSSFYEFSLADAVITEL